MYADDLQIYVEVPFNNTEGGILTLSTELTRISCWAFDNALRINDSKTQAIMFSRRNVDVNDMHIQISEIPIEWQEEINILGVHTQAA